MRGISWLAAKPVSFSRRTLLHGVSKMGLCCVRRDTINNICEIWYWLLTSGTRSSHFEIILLVSKPQAWTPVLHKEFWCLHSTYENRELWTNVHRISREPVEQLKICRSDIICFTWCLQNWLIHCIFLSNQNTNRRNSLGVLSHSLTLSLALSMDGHAATGSVCPVFYSGTL